MVAVAHGTPEFYHTLLTLQHNIIKASKLRRTFATLSSLLLLALVLF